MTPEAETVDSAGRKRFANKGSEVAVNPIAHMAFSSRALEWARRPGASPVDAYGCIMVAIREDQPHTSLRRVYRA